MAQPELARLAQGRVRADPRQDHAGARARRARLRQPAQPLHLLRPGGPRERASARTASPGRSTTLYDELVARRPVADLGRQDATRRSRRRWTRRTSSCASRRRPTARSAYRAFQAEEKKVGLAAHRPRRGDPQRPHAPSTTWRASRAASSTRPCWTGIIDDGRTYTAYASTSSGSCPGGPSPAASTSTSTTPATSPSARSCRPTSRGRDPAVVQDLVETPGRRAAALRLNYLTPHGKWNIHSTYGDNLRMLTLSRGAPPALGERRGRGDASASRTTTGSRSTTTTASSSRAPWSARASRRACAILYHAPERTISRAASRRRAAASAAGGHNSLTRIRLKPTLMLGGYGAVHLRLQLLGPDRDQPRHLRPRAQARRRAAATSGGHAMDVRAQLADGLPPRQVHRLPHLQRRLQERVDRPPRRRVHVVEQRRDQARHRLPDAAGRTRSSYKGGWDVDGERAPAAGSGRRAGALARDLPQPDAADARRLLRALDVPLPATSSRRAEPATTSRPRAPSRSSPASPWSIEAGPNWDDDLSGSNALRREGPEPRRAHAPRSAASSSASSGSPSSTCRASATTA